MIKYNGTDVKNVYYNGTDLSKAYYNGTLVFERDSAVTEYYSKLHWSHPEISVCGSLRADVEFTLGLQTNKNAFRWYLGIKQTSLTPVFNKTLYSNWMYYVDEYTSDGSGTDGSFEVSPDNKATIAYQHATQNFGGYKTGTRLITSITGENNTIRWWEDKNDWYSNSGGSKIYYSASTREFTNQNTSSTATMVSDNYQGSKVRYQFRFFRQADGGLKLGIKGISDTKSDNLWNTSWFYSDSTIYLGKNPDGSQITYGGVLLKADTKPIRKNTVMSMYLNKDLDANGVSGKITFDGYVFSGKLVGWWFYDETTSQITIDTTNKDGVTTFKASIQGNIETPAGSSSAAGLITYNNNTGFSGSITIKIAYFLVTNIGEYEEWKLESVPASEGFTKRGLRVGYRYNGEGDFSYGDTMYVEENG
jgi:hypothetical protein